MRTIISAIISLEHMLLSNSYTRSSWNKTKKKKKRMLLIFLLLILCGKRVFFPKSRQACEELRLKKREKKKKRRKSISVSLPSSKDFHWFLYRLQSLTVWHLDWFELKLRSPLWVSKFMVKMPAASGVHYGQFSYLFFILGLIPSKCNVAFDGVE